jgi:hypothetical protein
LAQDVDYGLASCEREEIKVVDEKNRPAIPSQISEKIPALSVKPQLALQFEPTSGWRAVRGQHQYR